MLPRTPDFLIAGAAKCGTTSLHRYLSEHPRVFATRHKELNYFALDDPVVAAGWPDLPFPIRSWEEYCECFAAAGDDQLAFEASPIYFDSPMAPARIAEKLPSAKILVSLRDPRERAWSGYLMHIREGEKPVAEKDFVDPAARYISGGFYADKLGAYQSVFGDRLKVVFFDDIKSDIENVMRSIFDFIGIEHFVSESYVRRHNVASYPRFRPLN
ncbi:MAG: sulfotransferase, partial [Gammaproteobacteria bacterium]|nr:sulfotransferase [Gammaproteobacteria bacterium]